MVAHADPSAVTGGLLLRGVPIEKRSGPLTAAAGLRHASPYGVGMWPAGLELLSLRKSTSVGIMTGAAELHGPGIASPVMRCLTLGGSSELLVFLMRSSRLRVVSTTMGVVGGVVGPPLLTEAWVASVAGASS